MVAMQAAQPALFVRASDGLREHQVGKRGGTASMQTAYYEHCGHQYEYCEHETRTRARARASTAAACTCRCAAAAFGDLEQSLSSSQVSCGVVLPVIELYTLGASVSTRSLHGPVKFFSSVQTCLYGTTSVRPCKYVRMCVTVGGVCSVCRVCGRSVWSECVAGLWGQCSGSIRNGGIKSCVLPHSISRLGCQRCEDHFEGARWCCGKAGGRG